MPMGTIIQNSTFLINNARPNDSGDYTCWPSQESPPKIISLHVSSEDLLETSTVTNSPTTTNASTSFETPSNQLAKGTFPTVGSGGSKK